MEGKVQPLAHHSVVSGAIFIHAFSTALWKFLYLLFLFLSPPPPTVNFFQMTSISSQLPILLAGYASRQLTASWSAKRRGTAPKTSPFPFTKSPCLYLPVLVHAHCWALPLGRQPPHAIHQYLSARIFKASFSVLSANNLAMPWQTTWNVIAIPWKTANFKPSCKHIQISLLLNITKRKEKPSLLVTSSSDCPSCILQCIPQAAVEGSGLAVSTAISPACLMIQLLVPPKAWNGIFKGHWWYPRSSTRSFPVLLLH